MNGLGLGLNNCHTNQLSNKNIKQMKIETKLFVL